MALFMSCSASDIPATDSPSDEESASTRSNTSAQTDGRWNELDETEPAAEPAVPIETEVVVGVGTEEHCIDPMLCEWSEPAVVRMVTQPLIVRRAEPVQGPQNTLRKSASDTTAPAAQRTRDGVSFPLL